MSTWQRLAERLGAQPHGVTLDWAELEALTGNLPDEARTSADWWLADVAVRPESASWHDAGLRVSAVDPGTSISFVPGPKPWAAGATPPPLAAELADPEPQPAPRTGRVTGRATTRPDIVLVEPDREQGPHAAPAGELFTGPLFTREKAYARWTGAPWFVLSGEYGLLTPDQVVGPSDHRLFTGSPEHRAAWGAWTVARLELLAGPLRRARVEVHAATPAVSEALRPHLLGLGAYVLEPLRGLSVPDRIAWYDGTVPRAAGPATYPAVAAGDPITAALGDAARAARPSDLLAGIDPDLRRPGIHSWFVDEAGAAQLSAGLGSRIAPGLIWIGQAGAVRPGSGLSATTTLRNQIAWVHLGRSVRLSPLRRMLAAILLHAPESGVTGEDALTDWIRTHLRVAIVAPADVEHLAEAADRAAARLGPQLSVEHADPAVRPALRELRSGFDGFPR